VAVCIQTPVNKIQNLSAAMTADHYVRVVGLLEGKFASIRPVDSLLISSKNLFNPYAEDVLLNHYLISKGNPMSNNSYHTSGYIRVTEGKTYSFSINGTAKNVRGICYFDANNVVLSAPENINTFTAPAGCKTIRFYIAKGNFYSLQLEEAASPTGYVPFSEKIKESLLPTIVVTGTQMNAIRLSGTLAQNGELTTPINIYKGILLSAKITGTVESVLVGLGINGYYGRWIEVTQTQIILYDRNGQHSAPRTHGLTLGAFTTIELSKDDNTGNFKARIINDYGALYEWDMQNIGLAGGNPAIVNNGTQSIQAKFVVFPRDLSAKIWGFGDSYFSFQDPARWTYYAINWGYDKWLINALGGEASAAGLTNLQTLINTGARPEYVMWCYGMNDGADTTEPDATWLANTQAMIQLCENNQITPILATIPTIPSKSHAQKNAWIRQSGYRYIDFAEYVEANGSDYWRGWGTDDQLLGNDETHPTQKGAKVLWQAVLNYFPEIATNF
jgi:lysophospholipase L1-like esterase